MTATCEPAAARTAEPARRVATTVSAPLLRSVQLSAVLTLAGVVLSGPVSLWVVRAIHPQPAWQGTEAFVRAFHAIQVSPFLAGLLLIGGFITLIAALVTIAPERLRLRSTIALICTGVFAALIVTNYVIQTTVVPALVRSGAATNDGTIAALTMSNPDSAGWALEMWGYAILGVATWLIAPALRAVTCNSISARLFALNGPLSIAGAVATVASPGWMHTQAGFVAFALWNLVVVAMSAAIVIDVHTQLKDRTMIATFEATA